MRAAGTGIPAVFANDVVGRCSVRGPSAGAGWDFRRGDVDYLGGGATSPRLWCDGRGARRSAAGESTRENRGQAADCDDRRKKNTDDGDGHGEQSSEDKLQEAHILKDPWPGG